MESGKGETNAADRLLANRERIIARWQERVRATVGAAVELDEPVLTDVMPVILRQLAETLAPDHPRRTATEGTSVAEEHGGERVRLTRYRIEDLVAEYKLLREAVLEVLQEEGPLATRERATIHASIDEAIVKSCSAYSLVQAGQREQFFAILAHDIRSPLGAARASAQMIVRKPVSEHVTRWAVRTVDAIDRVDRMLQDLLDAMRVEAGAALPLELQAGDFVQAVRESIEQLQMQYGERFVLAAPTGPASGWFSRDGIRRAVENLASNAVKYGAPGRPVTISVRELHGRVLLRVHNEGAPIPPDEQETLFRAFQRSRGALASGRRGWGLGLAQVRGVAEAHGGSITVDSSPELGTTFTIDVPADARPYVQAPPAH